MEAPFSMNLYRPILCALVLLGCQPSGSVAADRSAPLRVVATFSILGDLARTIGGAEIEVRTLVGPDSDAHVYEPAPEDARAIARADLVIANGLGFEHWLPRLVDAAGFRGTVVLATAGVMPRIPAGQSEPDPHAWQDPANGRRYVANISRALGQADERHAALYNERADRLDERLEALDRSMRRKLAAVSREERRILTSHDAFGYLGQAYEIEFIAIQHWNTAIEPVLSDLTRLIREIRLHGVKVVFVENITNPRLVQMVAAETNARVGGTLYSDALSNADGAAATYPMMLAYNLDKISEGLMRQR